MKKVLIVWGGWPGHRPEDGARMVADLLTEDGFLPTVTPDYDALGEAADYDLVVPCVTGDHVDDAAVAGLTAAVRDGVGLGGYHHCLSTSFRGSVKFHYLCGVQWVAHPGDDTVAYRVNITAPEDPVMQGITDFDYRSEQYYLHYDPSVELLATTTFSGDHDPATKGVVMPVAFKRRFGAGRIFYSALGHVPAELSHPQARTILRRGLNWATRHGEQGRGRVGSHADAET